jgi:hypothetical protein
MVIHEAMLNHYAPQWARLFPMMAAIGPNSISVMKECLAIGYYIGLALLFFWPVFTGHVPIPTDLLPHAPPWSGLNTVNPPPIRNPIGSDMLWLFYPFAHFRHIVADQTLFPFWNPYIFAGTPFLAESSNSQILQPIHLLFAFFQPRMAIAISMPLYLALAGIGMYAFLRNIDLVRGAALIGGTIYMFASVAAWWLLLSYFHASVVWLLPVALAGTELVLRGRFRLGLSLCVGALCLTLFGNTQVSLYTALAVGFYAAWMSVVSWKNRSLDPPAILQRLGYIAVSVILALAIATVQLLPSLELIPLSHRAMVTDPSVVMPLPLHRLLTVLLPGIGGYPPDGTIWSSTNLFDSTMYVGILSLVLAVSAVWKCPTRYVAWGIVLILSAFVLALALPSPHILSTILPPLQLFPQLGRSLILAKLGFALLAALGANAWLRRTSMHSDPLLRALVILLVILLFGAAIDFLIQEWPSPDAENHSLALTALWNSTRWLLSMSLVSGGVLALTSRWKVRAPYSSTLLLSGIVFLDLAGFSAPLYTHSPYSEIFPPTPITDYLQRQQTDRHFRVIGVPRTTLLSNSAMVYGLFDARGYSALYPLRILQYSFLVNGKDLPTEQFNSLRSTAHYSDHHRVDLARFSNMQLLSLLNVEYIMIDNQYRPSPPLDLSSLEFVMEQPGLRGAKLYRNPGVLPRAFLVGSAETVVDAAAAARRLQDSEFDPAREVVLESNFELPSFAVPLSSNVEIVSYEPERVRIHVESDGPAWLLLTDTFYPGWEATVNGEEAPIYAADLLFRAVAVPAGSSTVEFAYNPASWRWGVRISLAALSIWVFILLLPLRRWLPRLGKRQQSSSTPLSQG